MIPSDIVFKPVRHLAQLVRTRRVSPIELAETFIEWLDTLGPRYNALVTLTPDLAMEQARRAEREAASGRYRGPLHGIPYGLKDLFAPQASLLLGALRRSSAKCSPTTPPWREG